MEYDSIITILTEKAKDYELCPLANQKFILASIYKYDFVNALFYANKLITIVIEKADTISIIDTYKSKANCLYNLRRLKESMDELDSAFKYLQKLNEINNLCFQIKLETEIEELKTKSELTIKDRRIFNEKGTIIELKIPYQA